MRRHQGAVCDAAGVRAPRTTLTGQLRVLWYALSDVSTAILSHLHEHHIGGIAEQTAAELRVSAAEWQICPRSGPEPRGFLRNHIQIPGSKWH